MCLPLRYQSRSQLCLRSRYQLCLRLRHRFCLQLLYRLCLRLPYQPYLRLLYQLCLPLPCRLHLQLSDQPCLRQLHQLYLPLPCRLHLQLPNHLCLRRRKYRPRRPRRLNLQPPQPPQQETRSAMPGQMLQTSHPTSQDYAASHVHRVTVHRGLVSARHMECHFPILLRKMLDVPRWASMMDIRAYARSRALEITALQMLVPQAADELRM